MMRIPGTRIGGVLRKRRQKLEKTLTQVSQASGVHYSNIARVENGERRATAELLIKLAGSLGYGKVEILIMAGYLEADG